MYSARERPSKEVLTSTQRVGELVGIAIMLLVFGYFAEHQATGTGFYTSAFGPMEKFLLYGPLLFAMAAPLARALVGRRNPARPLDVAQNLFSTVSALWLLIVFPFDFTHFAEPLPEGMRFLLSWINDTVGRIGLSVMLIVSPIVALVTAWQFFAHLGREPGNSWS